MTPLWVWITAVPFVIVFFLSYSLINSRAPIAGPAGHWCRRINPLVPDPWERDCLAKDASTTGGYKRAQRQTIGELPIFEIWIKMEGVIVRRKGCKSKWQCILCCIINCSPVFFLMKYCYPLNIGWSPIVECFVSRWKTSHYIPIWRNDKKKSILKFSA